MQPPLSPSLASAASAAATSACASATAAAACGVTPYRRCVRSATDSRSFRCLSGMRRACSVAAAARAGRAAATASTLPGVKKATGQSGCCCRSATAAGRQAGGWVGQWCQAGVSVAHAFRHSPNTSRRCRGQFYFINSTHSRSRSSPVLTCHPQDIEGGHTRLPTQQRDADAPLCLRACRAALPGWCRSRARLLCLPHHVPVHQPQALICRRRGSPRPHLALSPITHSTSNGGGAGPVANAQLTWQQGRACPPRPSSRELTDRALQQRARLRAVAPAGTAVAAGPQAGVDHQRQQAWVL